MGHGPTLNLYRAFLRLTRVAGPGRRVLRSGVTDQSSLKVHPQLYPGQIVQIWIPPKGWLFEDTLTTGKARQYWPLPSLTRRLRENARFAIEIHADEEDPIRLETLVQGGWQDFKILEKLGRQPKASLELLFPEAFRKIEAQLKKQKDEKKGRLTEHRRHVL